MALTKLILNNTVRRTLETSLTKQGERAIDQFRFKLPSNLTATVNHDVLYLQDLANLEKTLTNKINLGLDVGSSDVLSELSDEIKPRNFVHSIGIDFIKNCFSFEKKIFKDFRNKIITELNKNNFIKDQFLNFADNRFKL